MAVSQNIKPLCNNWCGRKSCPLSERGVTAVLLQPCPRKGRGVTQWKVLAVDATCMIPQPTVKTECQKNDSVLVQSFWIGNIPQTHLPNRQTSSSSTWHCNAFRYGRHARHKNQKPPQLEENTSFHAIRICRLSTRPSPPTSNRRR